MKLKWECVGNGYDLRVKNPETVDIAHLRKLLAEVEVSSANWRKNMCFNQRASKAFREWFRVPSGSLHAYAYCLLSNWFLTSLDFVRESPRGKAALKLWKAMFCDVPEKRLTDPKRNDVILPEVFNLWWENSKSQEYC